MHKDSEFTILEMINESPETVSQRNLAEAAEISLGLTNAILKKLVSRGLLVMKRINSRYIRYALTPQGMNEVAWRSEALLRRTLGNVGRFGSAVEQLVIHLKSKGYKAIILQGESELDFLVEWACMKHKLSFNPPESFTGAAVYNQKELLLQLKYAIKLGKLSKVLH